ncbi:MAG: hypothetical protein APR53_03235 [Methanoculleus sp. SDB]|nr:MAG: hypothetical protein APR53_03235 [Methanoculleus sp. SDB]
MCDTMEGIECVARRLRDSAPVAIALSGGTDSLVLLAIAAAGRIHAAGVTVDTGMNPAGERERAEQIARRLGVPSVIIPVNMLALPSVAANAPDRCYACKRRMMEEITAWARDNGYRSVADGTHADDRADTRPGMKALGELGIISPFAECGIKKAEIAEFAATLDVPVLPSSSCLATRFPGGAVLSPGEIDRVREAEAVVRTRVKGYLRVRVDGTGAIVECDPAECPDAMAMTEDLTRLGFSPVRVRPVSREERE